jgi:hypothetical protein
VHTCPLPLAVGFSANLPSPSFTQFPAECAVLHIKNPSGLHGKDQEVKHGNC